MDPSIQYTLFILLAPLAAVISVGVIVYAWRTYPAPATRALLWLMGAISGWLVFNTLELVANSASRTLFWAKVTYPFIAATPLIWLAFVLRYTNKQSWLVPARFGWLCIIPLITVVFAQTNDWHHLLWQSYRFLPMGRLLAMQVVAYGWWFWIHISYSYLLVFIGAFLISKQYFASFQLYRQQSSWLVIGALSPIVFNILYIFHLIPGLRKDYTSISFAFGSIAFAIGMVRYQLFELKPVARDAVIDGMSDAVLTLDVQDRIVDLNPAAQALLSTPESAIIGQPAAQVLEPWQTLVERFQDATDVQTDIAIAQDAGTLHYDLRISPLLDRRGRLTGRLIVLRDITERKSMEEALRQRTTELEARNTELDAFAHTVAHDLKNPLTTIVGYGIFIRNNFKDMPPEELDHSLDTIVRTGHKMVTIVEALLLLSSVRQIADIEIVPLDMGSIVAEALRRLRSDYIAANAKIIKPQLWPVAAGYESWVEEVWVNYISNALKYGGTPPRVELGAEEIAGDASADGKPIMRFWVQDNGPGLSPEQQSELFSLFSRLDEERAEGHGLGLSIVQRIVNKLGGEVGVESAVGQGSTFWFTLPLAPKETL